MRVKYLLKILVILALFILVLNLALASEEQEIRSDLLKLSNVKEEMVAEGMGVARINDLITEGFVYFNNKNYDKTKEVISSIYELRESAFRAQSELSVVNQIYLGVIDIEKNISLINVTSTKIEWDLSYAQREFEKENYEGALETLEQVKKSLVQSINNEYGYLVEAVAGLEEKTVSLELSKSRIITLKSLLTEALTTGMLDELDIIKEDTENLGKSLSYYEEVKLLIPALEEKGLSSDRITDELKAVELNLNVGDYKDALGKLENLRNLAQDALRLEEDINELGKSISNEINEKSEIILEIGSEVGFEEAEELLKQAKYELVVGNYELAEQKFLSARNSFENLKTELIVGKAGLKGVGFRLEEFIRNKWAYILLVIFIILMVLKFTHSAMEYELRKNKLAKLKKELMVSEKIVQELQKDYFVHRKMARESYDENYDALQEKIMKIKDRILHLSQLNKKVNKVR